MKTSLFLCTLATCAWVSTTACKRGQTVSTPGGQVTYSENGKDAATVSFTGKNGEKVTMDMNSGKLPADYPSDAPVYKEAKITVAQSISEKNGRNLVMESKDPADKIAAFYKSGLESNGWKVEGTVAAGDLNMITATKGGRQFAVQITNSKDQRLITQMVTDK